MRQTDDAQVMEDRKGTGVAEPIPNQSSYKYPWLNVKLFVGLWTRFPYPACATQGVPRRANALSCNSSLRITATKAKLPGFPR